MDDNKQISRLQPRSNGQSRKPDGYIWIWEPADALYVSNGVIQACLIHLHHRFGGVPHIANCYRMPADTVGSVPQGTSSARRPKRWQVKSFRFGSTDAQSPRLKSKDNHMGLLVSDLTIRAQCAFMVKTTIQNWDPPIPAISSCETTAYGKFGWAHSAMSASFFLRAASYPVNLQD